MITEFECQSSLGKPYITSLQVEFEDVYVWKFDDQHIEAGLNFSVYVEADIECERHYIYSDHEGYHSRFRTIPSYAELGFDISAEVVGEDISLLEIEDVYKL